MPITPHTQPDQIVDKNGRQTTVHRGRAGTSSATSTRVSSIGTPAKRSDGIIPGVTTFYAPYNDGQFEFTVNRIKDDVVYAQAQPGNEWGLGEQIFSLAEVRQKIAWAEKFESLESEQADFWESTPVGTVLHYDDGFGKFVRGTVVIDPADGAKKLKPEALVGNWSAYDLSVRQADGSISEGYHVRAINENKMFAPSPGNIWENLSLEARSRGKYAAEVLAAGGPGALVPADLTVPEMTPDEARSARIEKALGSVGEAATAYKVSQEDRITALRKILADIDSEL